MPNILTPTEVYRKIARGYKDHRLIVNYGGSGSSKTVSTMQAVTNIAKLNFNKVITVIGESVPVLKRSVIQDWRTLVMTNDFDYGRYNASERIYRFPSGSIIQFVPGDDATRFHGPRQDYAVFDEAYNIKKDIFDQVEIRTRKNIFLTWNPVSPFWGKLLTDRDDCLTIHSTYKDNPYLEQAIIESLERRAGIDENFYRVYVLGEYGSIEGLIYKEGEHWKIVKEFPKDERGVEVYKWRVFGLDFGFTNNESGYLEVTYADGQLWARQHIYKKGLTNDVIAEMIKKKGFAREQNVADSAEPKSIKEIQRNGIKIRGAEKGPDSVKYGIGLIKQYRLNVHHESVDLIKELRNYSWAKDRHGEPTGKPVPLFDHLLDALRYAVTYRVKYPGTGRYSVS